MELLGVKRAFAHLLATDMVIKSFISDRHGSITKWMKTEFPIQCRSLGKSVINHFFDLWHVAKSKINKYYFIYEILFFDNNYYIILLIINYY